MRGASSFALAALALVAAHPARAEASADEFLKGMNRGDDMSTVLLLAYTVGFSWANTELQMAGRPMLYCVPPKLALRREQAGSILLQYVKAHPKSRTFPAGMVMLDAMQQTFPCSTQNR